MRLYSFIDTRRERKARRPLIFPSQQNLSSRFLHRAQILCGLFFPPAVSVFMSHRCFSVACSQADARVAAACEEPINAGRVARGGGGGRCGHVFSAAWKSWLAYLLPALQTLGLSAGRGRMSPLFTAFKGGEIRPQFSSQNPQCYFTPAYLAEHRAAVCVPHKGT